MRRQQQQQQLFLANFAAKQIQAHWRGYVLRSAFLLQRFAAMHIQAWWRKIWRSVRDKRLAASCIQRCWRSYCPRKIYHFFRDLVLFKEKEPPRDLLKSINPKEAALFDGATGLHVRFRLGGFTFPPMLFYKIFTHRPISDVCAYCPRDYTQDKPRPRRAVEPSDSVNWYCRTENNEWRPVLATMLPMLTEPSREQRLATLHYAPIVRHQELVKHRKLRKRQWLQKAYLRAEQDEQILADADEDIQLMDWNRHLNFDSYIREWSSLACSAGSSEITPDAMAIPLQPLPMPVAWLFPYKTSAPTVAANDEISELDMDASQAQETLLSFSTMSEIAA